ncbi:PTS-dependent dihydroxyacetone kinase phosphotransferase subunit DhaM [Ruania suaedae]|uniref:dihydroxyacetone kinase phosphoryl donor subunit DhaM n=1 Tax=Ruania suaedae TaxID=2897774 RepID=UPI001E45FC8E|nr:dihydroxyacetone kinase phosphoryl donor subunit DhaM [Ruania suaedae]UFU04128.1 PTS-dependent dihydroxyacetone kinase phosphotransferase subunit DhaM [Ruania suaedae]
MSEPTTALVLVSHSAALAAGVAEVAAQMAPQVSLRPAGGTEDGRIGTSYDLVEGAVTDLLDGGARSVVILTDLGSAAFTAESVVEMLDDERVLQADAPFVEGAVAAAVTAQGGGDGPAVLAAAHEAGAGFGSVTTAGAPADTGDARDAPDRGEVLSRTLVLRNRLGLHARPAALLARRVGTFDAEVSLNGVDAASVLAIMGLGLTGGDELALQASGREAAQALDAVQAEVDAGFGEE